MPFALLNPVLVCNSQPAPQFGFARRVVLPKGPSGRGSSSQGSGNPPAAASQPASLATDDTPLALGQVGGGRAGFAPG